MQVTQRIFTLLKHQNKSKADLARYLEIRPTTVTEWDTKGKKPSVEYIYRISEFLGVSTDYLLTGKEFSGQSLTENEKELLENFNKLTERQQLKLIVKAEDMVEQNENN